MRHDRAYLAPMFNFTRIALIGAWTQIVESRRRVWVSPVLDWARGQPIGIREGYACANLMN